VSATIILVHSPFLGPASLRPLADALAAHGHPAVLLDLRPSIVSPPVHQVLLGVFADVIADAELSGPVVLAGHSGAGPLLPAMADTFEEPVTGLIYLDAGLPTPGKSWRDTVDPALYTALRDRTREGLLPRWHLWFPDHPLETLVPDPVLRAEIADEAPEVPIAFLKEARPDVEWPGPAAYLCLSSAYADDLQRAKDLGWPAAKLDLTHLAPATDPEPVAEAILQLLIGMSVEPPTTAP
jgi:pimeloyl-ACP methyl ester carboxylesterase